MKEQHVNIQARWQTEARLLFPDRSTKRMKISCSIHIYFRASRPAQGILVTVGGGHSFTLKTKSDETRKFIEQCDSFSAPEEDWKTVNEFLARYRTKEKEGLAELKRATNKRARKGK